MEKKNTNLHTVQKDDQTDTSEFLGQKLMPSTFDSLFAVFFPQLDI